MTKTGIIIQARMLSTRLPGKTLKLLAGKPLLWHTVKRCKASTKVDLVIVATSTEEKDDVIESFCKGFGFECFRGNLENVLERYYKCAKEYDLDYIVRVAGASPLLDPTVIDGAIQELWDAESDGVRYVSNVLERNFPRGLEVEVFSFETLKETYENASTEEELEHVTPYTRKHFKSKAYVVPEALRGDFRLTIDEIDDFKLVDHIYEKFYKEGNLIDMKKVISYLKENPDIASMNSHVEQKKVSY